MKRFSMLFAAGLVASITFIAGCGTMPAQSPAEIAANICPGVQSEIDALRAAGVFTGGAQVTLTNQVQPDVDAVCAAGATVSIVGIRQLVQATFPVVVTVIANSTLTDQQKLQATLAVGVVVSGINTALSLQSAPITTPTAPAAASGVTTS